MSQPRNSRSIYTLQGTNISICQSFLKMFFLFRRMGFLENICKCPIPNWCLYHVQLASWSWPKMVSSASITGCIWVLELGSVTFQRIQVSKILPDPTTKTFVLTSKTPNKNIPHQPPTPPNQKKNSITHPRGAWQKTPGLWSKILDSLDLELPRQTKRGGVLRGNGWNHRNATLQTPSHQSFQTTRNWKKTAFWAMKKNTLGVFWGILGDEILPKYMGIVISH